ncbi:MAG: lipopolysaccharide biosynthesis protein [Bacteroidota bacterium]
MDIKSFLKLVNKYKWLLILVPVISIVITYFLVQNLPKQYKSNVEISTGLLDPTKKVITDENVDFFKVNQQFNGIMEKMKTKKILNILSYRLILHDLQNPHERFKKYSEQLDSLNIGQRKELINIYQKRLDNKSVLTLLDDSAKYKVFSLIESMGYGEESLKKQIDISHTENSDLIKIEYISENPYLSVFVVNTLAKVGIANYTDVVNINENNSNELLDSIVLRKKAVMDGKNAAISSFKMSNGVVDPSEQASSINGSITKYETQRSDFLTQIDQDQAALDEVTNKLRALNGDNPGSARGDNREIVSLRNQLATATSNFIDNRTLANRKKVDSLSALLNSKRDNGIGETGTGISPLTSKQSLLLQQSNLQLDLVKAKSSFRSIDATLASLKTSYNRMLPYGANIQNMQAEATIATKEYTDALDSYNKSRNIQNVNGFRLQIDQEGLPGTAEPSKRSLYLAGAGFGSLMLSLGYIFILFALDNSITNLRQLERVTKSKTIGALNNIQDNEKSIRDIWNDKSGNKNFEIYRDLLRSLRFEISEKMDADGSKILGITSLVAGEGKTFIAYSLAYSFAMTGKKILLIADDFPTVKSENKELTTSQDFQTFLIKKEIHTEDLITILSKNAEQGSLLENQSFKSLKVGFDALREEFDLIVIDVNSLHDMNIAKEWLLFTEHNVAVFASGRSIDENDLALVKYIKDKPNFIGWILNKMEFKKI